MEEGFAVVVWPAVGGGEDGEAGVAFLVAEAVDVNDEGASGGCGSLLRECGTGSEEGR